MRQSIHKDRKSRERKKKKKDKRKFPRAGFEGGLGHLI